MTLFDLDLPPAELDGCMGWLDPAERARASRFRDPRDRDRFVARRGHLRRHLADRVGVGPDRLRIVADDHGRPFLPDASDLAFSLSKSHGLALCATSHGGAVGCDIEWRDPELACAKVAERLFAREEYDALAALPPDRWVEGFFNCWTRKEAYVKALGLGLSYPLDAFRVSVEPGEPARFVTPEPGWTLTAFEPASGFQAALVTAAG